MVCQFCGDAIGVYEPVAVLGDDAVRVSSLAREPGLGSKNAILAHKGCLPTVHQAGHERD